MTAGPFPAAAVAETHVAWILLLGDRAYKIKKPVDFGFLDFSTRELRLAACRREVELNRRLAPDVYLDVATVSDGDGRPVEHVVVMRRMPDDRRLSTLVAAGEPLADGVDRLARLMAAFHATAARSARISAEGGRDAIERRWRDSFEQTRTTSVGVIAPAVITEIETLTLDFLRGRAALFDARVAGGRVVDGHGDLLADDIFCLDDGPRVLDCLEFDDRLRWVDGLDDIAFLAMDLERLGAPALGARLLRGYAEFSGDPAPPSLWHHFVAYRAFVRAKVACLRHRQGDPTAAEQARRHADIALQHLRLGRVRLVVVGGLPGSGKTTLGGALADRLGAVLLSSDRIRKERAGRTPELSAAAPYRTGLYAAPITDAVYRELVRRAEMLLGMGESVVLDASWLSSAHRDRVRELADRAGCPLTELRCVAPAAVTAERIAHRDGSLSDATAEIGAMMATATDPWPSAVVVPTDGSVERAVDSALRAVETTADAAADEPAAALQ